MREVSSSHTEPGVTAPRDETALRTALERIDGRGYKAYLTVAGTWTFGDFTLSVDHVQSDPFAAPTRVHVVLPAQTAALPESAYRSRARRLGSASYLARAFCAGARARPSTRGTGRSGEIRMEDPGQVVLDQTAVRIGEDGGIEARFTVGLPAWGRRIAGRDAVTLLAGDLPDLVRGSLPAAAHAAADIERSAATNEDADALRAALPDAGLVAFVADGAHLPRRSGVDDRPLEESVVAFRSPDSLRVVLETPNAGPVPGMGIPEGVTLVVGGGFHGKSTLLRALEAGVFDHHPDDGRERVVSRADAVKVRAEDGRPVTGVDISSFIVGLPGDRDTTAFTTANASGSTSQAAAICEALEVGARVLLVDEDTSATNFMIRDRRMQALVPEAAEPITPYVDRVREIREAGVSSVLVLGGSGDYLDVADLVIRMRHYLPVDVTDEARRVAEANPTGRTSEAKAPLVLPPPRHFDASSVDARKGRRQTHVRVPDDRTLLFGEQTVDLVAVEQVAVRAQTRAIGHALALLGDRLLADGASLAEALDALDELIRDEGLDALDKRKPGDLAAFRRFEVAAALNRLRSARVRSPPP